jgi:hypothetical protein
MLAFLDGNGAVLPCGDDAAFLGDNTISWTATAWVSTTPHGRQQVAVKAVNTCGVCGVGTTWGQRQPRLLVDGEGTNSRHHSAARLLWCAVVSPWCGARRKAEEWHTEQGAGERCAGARRPGGGDQGRWRGYGPLGIYSQQLGSQEGQRASGGGDSRRPCPGMRGSHPTTPG